MIAFYGFYLAFNYLFPWGSYVFLVLVLFKFVVRVDNIDKYLVRFSLIFAVAEIFRYVLCGAMGIGQNFTSSFFFVISPLILTFAGSYKPTMLTRLSRLNILKLLLLFFILITFGSPFLSVTETDNYVAIVSYMYTLGANNLNITDLSFILVLILFFIDSSGSKLKLILTIVVSGLIAIALNKQLALEIVFFFVVLNFFSFGGLINMLRIIFLLILSLPYILKSVFSKISQDTFIFWDALSSYRFSIWREAIDSVHRLSSIFIGYGKEPFYFVDAFDEMQRSIEMSLHSGYIRLLYSEGIVFYTLKILLLWVLLEVVHRKYRTEHALRFTILSLIILFTDGSLFYGWSFLILFFMPLTFLLGYNTKRVIYV